MAGARRTSCSGCSPSIDTTIDSRGMLAHSIGIGRTALVTTCTCRPICDSARQQDVELTETHERLAADERHVQRPVLLDEADHAVDERLSLEVAAPRAA